MKINAIKKKSNWLKWKVLTCQYVYICVYSRCTRLGLYQGFSTTKAFFWTSFRLKDILYWIWLWGLLTRMTLMNLAAIRYFVTLFHFVPKRFCLKQSDRKSFNFILHFGVSLSFPIFFSLVNVKVYLAQCLNEKSDGKWLKAWHGFFSRFCRPFIQCNSSRHQVRFVCDRSIKSTIKWWMCLK